MPFLHLSAFSDWGWWVKPLLVPAAPVGHSLLSAVGAEAAASRGPGGGRPNLCRDLGGVRPPARSSQRDPLARRPHGNDTAPPSAGAETRSPLSWTLAILGLDGGGHRAGGGVSSKPIRSI